MIVQRFRVGEVVPPHIMVADNARIRFCTDAVVVYVPMSDALVLFPLGPGDAIGVDRVIDPNLPVDIRGAPGCLGGLVVDPYERSLSATVH